MHRLAPSSDETSGDVVESAAKSVGALQGDSAATGTAPGNRMSAGSTCLLSLHCRAARAFGGRCGVAMAAACDTSLV